MVAVTAVAMAAVTAGGGGGHGHFGGGGHAHFGGGHHGGGRFATSRSFSRSSFHGNRAFAGRGGPNFSRMRNAAVGTGNFRQRHEFAVARRWVAQRPPAQQSRGAGADRRRACAWQAGTAATSQAGGGSTATADMDGSVRCSGRSPITTSMITRSGETASASGTTATPTFTPEYLRLTAMTIWRAIWRRAPYGRRQARVAPSGAIVRR